MGKRELRHYEDAGVICTAGDENDFLEVVRLNDVICIR